jgi:hypothetical protein
LRFRILVDNEHKPGYKQLMLRKRYLKNIGLLVVLLFSLHCGARTIIVTDTSDTINIHSLRGAILEANRRGGQNTIVLGEGRNPHALPGQWVYHLTIRGADELEGRKGDLNITRGELTIMGASSNVIIDATGLGDRVFNISGGARVTLQNLIIRGGAPPASSKLFGSGEYGGAVLNGGTVILENCVISNNSSGSGQLVEGNGPGTLGGDGGGICNFGTLQASNCTIVGNASGGGSNGSWGGDGGGISNFGNCLLENCIIFGNDAGSGGTPTGNAIGFGGNGGNGGGIYNSGMMILKQCIVTANSAGSGANGGSSFPTGGWGGNGGNGGGIYNVGDLEFDFSTIYGNSTGNGGNGAGGSIQGNAGNGGNGGGIFNAGILSLNTSTISGNSCGNGGDGGNGGIWSGASGGTGGTGGSGGGIYNSSQNEIFQLGPGTLELASSTITLNMCGSGGNGGNASIVSAAWPEASSGGAGGSGGGIFNGADPVATVVRDSLIAQNSVNAGGLGGTNTSGLWIPPGEQGPVQIGSPGSDGVGFDLAGGFASQGFNLISTGDGSTGFANGVDADQVGTDANPIDPMLGPLQFNGGPTPTHALLVGSPAIDEGNSFGVHTDQRGYQRPFVYPWITQPAGGDGSDIGAFEREP